MLLGIDLGTTNIKAVLVQRSGVILARATAPVAIQHLAEGAVEQDIEEIWAATRAAIKQVGAAEDLSRAQAVGVSSQGGALQLLDGAERPLGRVISWLDGRGRRYDRALVQAKGAPWFTQRIGHGASGIALGQLERLRTQSPELLRPPNQIGFVGDVIVSRLCGRRAHDASSLSIAALLNPRLRAADPEVLEMVGLDERQLPDLLPPWEPAGRLLPEVAEDTGLPKGIPVSAAAHDQYASSLGVGATHSGDTMVGAGTAWVLLAAEDVLRDPVVGGAFVCPHLVAGLYGQMLSLANGGSSFSWVREVVGLREADECEIDRMLAAAPTGCEGLRFWPFLVSGTASGLDAEISGRLLGLRLSHTRDHLLRAVVEGLAFELARHLALLTAVQVPVRRLVLCGGAARSEVTPRIIADVTGLPVARSAEPDTSALGAAMIARSLAEGSDDLARLSDEMAPQAKVFEPGADRARYRPLLDGYLSALPYADGAEGRE